MSDLSGPPSAPYGPMTPRIRQFLLTVAGLGKQARAEVVTKHGAHVDSRAYIAAETALAETIERSGRTAERDALGGPLLQLLLTSARSPAEERERELDPIAEPALAALLALLVSDLLAKEHLATLTAPFGDVLALP